MVWWGKLSCTKSHFFKRLSEINVSFLLLLVTAAYTYFLPPNTSLLIYILIVPIISIIRLEASMISNFWVSGITSAPIASATAVEVRVKEQPESITQSV